MGSFAQWYVPGERRRARESTHTELVCSVSVGLVDQPPGFQLVRTGTHSREKGTYTMPPLPPCLLSSVVLARACSAYILATMQVARFLFAAAVVGCLVSTAAAFVVGSSSSSGDALRSSCVGTRATSAEHVQRRSAAVQSLRAASDDGEEGGFPNPYNAFRKWQMELVRRWSNVCSCTQSTISMGGVF